ncbi:putative siderophore biosynthesis protein SbnA [Tengunoibacter tsumagoiensis]|uniref:N-(2-amino-2-carboxyethyl)-L-glutamate synthase n=1 Tax=Tengunoibacter tsumagoiensis TaxID=2014871 RepID=A0A402A6J4_9CHLR|nr:putative siderophore biosynthesis protein SbnA [Tengunoibacter tsumagoiensis]
MLAKLECLNPGGSVKDRPAQFIIDQGLQTGIITPTTHLIESTSGNFGIALAMVACIYHLALTCVVDPNISPVNLQILRQLGANIEMVKQVDAQGGYLASRIQRVQELRQSIPHSYWINQYANELNWQAHYFMTAAEIISQVEDHPIDTLVIAVSTTGTLLGLARRLREKYPHLRVIAVDAVGSIIFGGPPLPRFLPGIGASRVPEILQPDEIDEVWYVTDREAVQGCQDLVLHEGILAGGSSGSVVAAIQKILQQSLQPQTLLTLLPDRGDRYINMIYDEKWVAQLPS